MNLWKSCISWFVMWLIHINSVLIEVCCCCCLLLHMSPRCGTWRFSCIDSGGAEVGKGPAFVGRVSLGSRILHNSWRLVTCASSIRCFKTLLRYISCCLCPFHPFPGLEFMGYFVTRLPKVWGSGFFSLSRWWEQFDERFRKYKAKMVGVN